MVASMWKAKFLLASYWQTVGRAFKLSTFQPIIIFLFQFLIPFLHSIFSKVRCCKKQQLREAGPAQLCVCTDECIKNQEGKDEKQKEEEGGDEEKANQLREEGEKRAAKDREEEEEEEDDDDDDDER